MDWLPHRMKGRKLVHRKVHTMSSRHPEAQQEPEDSSVRVDCALEGIRVLDLSDSIAGAYCTKLFAMQGADVVKVEPPDVGDSSRHIAPFVGDDNHPEKSIRHLYLNTGKKSVTLNLDEADGQSLLRRLVSDADALIETVTSERSRKSELSYDPFAALNPGLVMISITHFGHTGPYKAYFGEEIVAQALSGHIHITGEPDREPIQMGGNIVQFAGGQSAFVATLMAIYHVMLTGVGQYIDCSIVESGIDLLDSWGINSLSGENPKRVGNTTPNSLLRVRGGLYECSDGWVSIGTVPGGWNTFVDMVGQEELRDPKYSDPASRAEYHDEIEAIVEPWIRERSKLDIFRSSQNRRNVAGYVALPEDMLQSEQLQARQFFHGISHPLVGEAKFPGPPFQMSECESILSRAPLLGEHNVEVYSDRLGLDSAELERLSRQGVI